MVTRYLWDTLYKQRAVLLQATSNSFEVLLYPVKKTGIRCANWFEENNFNKRFNWLVDHEPNS